MRDSPLPWIPVGAILCSHRNLEHVGDNSNSADLIVFPRRLLALLVAAALITGAGEAFSQQAQSKIELDRLIQIYMTSKANHLLSWDTGSEAGTLISWQHAGFMECAPASAWVLDLSRDLDGPFCRSGKVLITVRGKPTHTVLERTVEPGRWKIILSGARAGINYVILDSDAMSPNFGAGSRLLENVTSKPGSAIAVRETGGCGSFSDGSKQFDVTAPGKVTAFVREAWSCGSGGCSTQFILAPAKEYAQDIIGCK